MNRQIGVGDSKYVIVFDPLLTGHVIRRMRRTETPKPISIKFCVVVDIPDIVTYTNFGDHLLRGFWVVGRQISPSPIDFHRRPYNTLALPCERVICKDTQVNRQLKSIATTIRDQR